MELPLDPKKPTEKESVTFEVESTEGIINKIEWSPKYADSARILTYQDLRYLKALLKYLKENGYQP